MRVIHKLVPSFCLEAIFNWKLINFRGSPQYCNTPKQVLVKTTLGHVPRLATATVINKEDL